MRKSKIEQDATLARKARKRKRLKTKRARADKVQVCPVRLEIRKGILRYYGSGIWQGDLKRMRRNRV